MGVTLPPPRYTREGRMGGAGREVILYTISTSENEKDKQAFFFSLLWRYF